eukprot:scaffold255780_cov15-Tisochrysis_lutea.AAC.1
MQGSHTCLLLRNIFMTLHTAVVANPSSNTQCHVQQTTAACRLRLQEHVTWRRANARTHTHIHAHSIARSDTCKGKKQEDSGKAAGIQNRLPIFYL